MRLPRILCDLSGRLLAVPVAVYIARQRDRLMPRSAAIFPESRAALSPYFSADLLAQVRVVESESLGIARPPFASAVRRMGLEFPAIELTAAITFDRLIATREPAGPRLLFHELVHAVQFRELGLRRFSRLYVSGFLANGSYDLIPLERCAYALEDRFASDAAPFDAEAEVLSWLKRLERRS